MLRNYIKTAFRNLWRHKSFSLINILGLSVGMTACLLILLYITFELSYDRFHQNGSNIYRLVTNIKTASDTIKTSSTSYPMGLNIKADFPEVEASTTAYRMLMLLQNGERKFEEKNIMMADSNFFSTFSFPLVYGSATQVLNAPGSVVLSEAGAKKYFGNENPIGKELLVEGKTRVMVSGVMKNFPKNSQFSADIIFPMSYFRGQGQDYSQEWGNFGWQTFLLLKPGTDPKKLEARFPDFLIAHGQKPDATMAYTLFLEPLENLYLKTERGGWAKGSMTNIYIFSVIALFILIIACINFVNLTTARATERAKEVGVRKVVGASKRELALQFLGESTVICLISFVLALVFSSLCGPLFNTLCGKEVTTSIFRHGGLLLLLLGVTLVIGLLAGIYPALVLTRFKPVSVLKGRFSSSRSGGTLRKSLVVVQFAVSIILIAGTIIVYKQLYYMQHLEMGFEKERLVMLNYYRDEEVNKHLEQIKHELSAVPGVQSVAATQAAPGTENWGAFTEVENPHGELQAANMDLYSVDFDFIGQMGMKMAAGRAFSVAFPTDSTEALIINESAAKALGYTNPADVVGKKFDQWGRKGKVIGVVRNFNYRSLKQPVGTLAMRMHHNTFGSFTVKIKPGDYQPVLAGLEKKWNVLVPHRPFDYQFVDQQFNKQYEGETRFSKLFLYFAGLAIMISCLGLLGLAAYSTVQRTREIGIRKVLGASVVNITTLLSKEFVMLVVIALCIAAPVAWYGMSKWVEDFAYQVQISWWVFAIAGLLAIAIALLTVSFHSIKAAIVNPVRSLRSE